MREKILRICTEICPNVDFENTHDLIDGGYIESFDAISIIMELMDEFDIVIDADDMEPENLNSLDAICDLVESKLP